MFEANSGKGGYLSVKWVFSKNYAMLIIKTSR